MKILQIGHICLLAAFAALLYSSGCSKAYYGAMEKAGIHKRDILVDRVDDARDAQSCAQEQFKDALEQFAAVVKIEIDRLIKSMNDAIDTSNDFIAELQQ